MIQRIQSVYLLVVAALCGVMFFTDLMWYGVEGKQLYLSALQLTCEGEVLGSTPIYFPILLGAATLLPFVTIFLFKRRMLQIRFCAVEMVLLVGCLAMEAMLYWGKQGDFTAGALTPAAFLPLVSLLLVWLAARAIFKDEMLVRSLDRIR